MTRLFGTDGIRGVANDEPLTPELAFRRDPAIASGRRVEDILRKLQDTGRDGTQEA